MRFENDEFEQTWGGLDVVTEDAYITPVMPELSYNSVDSIDDNNKTVCLYPNEWVSLYAKGDYIFSHETRCNGKIISVLPFKRVDLGDGTVDIQFLARFEHTPSWTEAGEKTISSLTGGVEKGEDPIISAIRELQEEAGIFASIEDMIPLGTSKGTKSSDTTYYLYTLDITNMNYLIHGEGDGSESEREAENLLLDSDTLMRRAEDPLLGLLLGRWLVYYKRVAENEGRPLLL